MEKRKPTGFVAVCQCGKAVGAIDLERSERADASRLLGRWLMDGCTVHPQFTSTWAAHIAPCECDDPAVKRLDMDRDRMWAEHGFSV